MEEGRNVSPGSQDPAGDPSKDPAENTIRIVTKDQPEHLSNTPPKDGSQEAPAVQEIQEVPDVHGVQGNNLERTESSRNSTPVTVVWNPSSAPLQPAIAVEPGSPHDAEKEQVHEGDGRRELLEEDCESQLGYGFSTAEKWWILFVIFWVQISMNFNTSLYSNGIPGIAQEFDVSKATARYGAALFLITYAFGCELWAPWSEEFGRKGVLQLSLLLVNIWTITVGLAPNITTVLVGRSLGGLSTAGGSVTLGVVADMYDSDNQQNAVAFVVFASVFGSILGPIIGGFIESNPTTVNWRWCIWIQLILGVVVQLVHCASVTETRTTTIVDRIAKKRRRQGVDPNIYGPGEMRPLRERFTFRELMDTWTRAFRMLIKEPIVRWLSLLSGLSDAIVFIQIQAMGLVYQQWNFTPWQVGLAFIPIAIGYAIAWAAFIPTFKSNRRLREQNPHNEHAQFESRLCPLLWAAPCLPIGLFIFGWAGLGPPLHWIGTMFGTTLIGIANYAIYMATIDYMVCSYGAYSASATGGNGLARDLLAGGLTFAAIPFYKNIDPLHGRNLQWASTILAIASIFLVMAAYYVYVKGPSFRKHSPFAQRLASRDEQFHGRHVSVPPLPAGDAAGKAPEVAQAGHGAQEPAHPVPVYPPRVSHDLGRMSGSATPVRPAFGPSSPHGSYMASVHAASRRQSRQASRNASANASRRNSQEGQSGAVPAASIGELLAEQLTNLAIIQSEANEPEE
ncbi:major facilitator superfamily domain-containing protein [Nemania sp. FL0916]|nr:major facilitator superfamily domain-containing protein [Nemania sp. FL0916]